MTNEHGLAPIDMRDSEIKAYRLALESIRRAYPYHSCSEIAGRVLDDWNNAVYIDCDKDVKFSIRTARIKSESTQKKVASALDINSTTIAHWEKLEKEGKIKSYMVRAVRDWFRESMQKTHSCHANKTLED